MQEAVFEDAIYWRPHRFWGAVLWSVLFLIAGVWLWFSGGELWHQGLGAGLALVAGGILFVSANLRVLRVWVASGRLNWSFGLFQRSISVGDVIVMGGRVFSHASSWSPAWGILPVMEGPERYTVWGGEGEALALVVNGPKGEARRYLISTHDADRLVAAIMRVQRDTLPRTPSSPLHVIQN